MYASLHASRKAAQGYRAPGAREGCRNCCYSRSSTSTYSNGPLLHCVLGRFVVSPSGICPKHQPAGEAGTKEITHA